MSRFFIIDTNVVVAGLLTSHPASPVARILDGMLNASFRFVLSEALLVEYRTVLLRPHLAKLHGLSETNLDTLLADITQHAIVLNAPTQHVLQAPDPGDQFLWNLMATRADLILVTGDKRLLDTPSMANRVQLPSVFAAAELVH